jgi:hypothetical protein
VRRAPRRCVVVGLCAVFAGCAAASGGGKAHDAEVADALAGAVPPGWTPDEGDLGADPETGVAPVPPDRKPGGDAAPEARAADAGPPPGPPPTQAPSEPPPDAPCEAGTTTLSLAGPAVFDVPAYETLTVELWGAGGGGGASGQSSPGTAGGRTRFGETVTAEGGAPGTADAGGRGGQAVGGDTNQPGGDGGPACHYPAICSVGAGGAAPNGGGGGQGVNAVNACNGGDGRSGDHPGGGGASSWTCQGPWWEGMGWGDGGGGGGAGGYAHRVFGAGEVPPGEVALEVGAAGVGARGHTTAGFPGTGRFPGVYTGGDGGAGRIVLTWTCP